MADVPTTAPASTIPASPFGLPSGSIRALLTLMIMGVILVELIRGRPLPVLWTETLAIALAHYFTSRRFVNLPPEALGMLEESGHLPRESNPLYLPKHSVRTLIVLGFAGLAVYLYREGRLLETQSLNVLGLVTFYIVGVLARGLVGLITRGRAPRASRWWTDIKATVVMLALIAAAGFQLIGRPEFAPEWASNLTLGLVLFYFGSR